jgi:hypothetical protein
LLLQCRDIHRSASETVPHPPERVDDDVARIIERRTR